MPFLEKFFQQRLEGLFWLFKLHGFISGLQLGASLPALPARLQAAGKTVFNITQTAVKLFAFISPAGGILADDSCVVPVVRKFVVADAGSNFCKVNVVSVG